MRLSQYPINTLKETPAEADIVSHQLMLRAGLIRRLGTGLYTWLPMGLRTLHKVEAIVREEMNRAGALELVMPIVQPAELWQESGRWEKIGPDLGTRFGAVRQHGQNAGVEQPVELMANLERLHAGQRRQLFHGAWPIEQMSHQPEAIWVGQ